MKKAEPNLVFETQLWETGYQYIAGIDEAGRGPWAGPVSAAAVLLPQNAGLLERLKGVRDSKQMSAKQRKVWREYICQSAIAWGVGFASVEEIDADGIISAVRLAIDRALQEITIAPDYLLLDYMKLPQKKIPQMALVRGDARCLSIAAASVLAKTARDELMCEVDCTYPGYGFAQNKGYGTAAHREAVQRLGICSLHRRSYAPIRALLG